MKTIIRSSVVLVLFTILLCGVYPLSVTLVGNLLFGDKSQGSLIVKDGKIVGSSLIGQNFTKPQYLHGRISAAGDKGYDAANSSGSNLGPTSKKLMDRIKADVERVRKGNPTVKDGKVPTEMVTASGSGLDPHLSPHAAEIQIVRIATSRKASEAVVKRIVDHFTEGPQWGIFGEPTVNVLLVNLELDKILPMTN